MTLGHTANGKTFIQENLLNLGKYRKKSVKFEP